MFTSIKEKIWSSSFSRMYETLSNKNNISHIQAKNGTKIYYDAFKIKASKSSGEPIDLSKKDHVLTKCVAEKLKDYIDNNPFFGFKVKKALNWGGKIAILTTAVAFGCALLAVASPYIFIAATVSILVTALLYGYDYSLKTKRDDYINKFLDQLNQDMKPKGELYQKSRYAAAMSINWCRGGTFALACPDLGFYSLNWDTIGKDNEEKMGYENVIFKSTNSN